MLEGGFLAPLFFPFHEIYQASLTSVIRVHCEDDLSVHVR